MRAGLAKGIVFGFPLSLMLWTIILLPVYWPLLYPRHIQQNPLSAASANFALTMKAETKRSANPIRIRNHPYYEPSIKSLNEQCLQSQGGLKSGIGSSFSCEGSSRT